MRRMLLSACLGLFVITSAATAAEISGEYLEARSCNVYTGPCFANAEADQAGKEAIVAWRVDQGSWNDVTLDGLGVALILKAEGTLGDDGIFEWTPGHIRAVVLVDDKANDQQHEALLSFVQENAPHLTGDIVDVKRTPIQLENQHLDGAGVFKAGDLAEITTRALAKGDCICSNEVIYYQPLTEVENSSPAFSLMNKYQGDGLDSRWVNRGMRSAFLATFRK